METGLNSTYGLGTNTHLDGLEINPDMRIAQKLAEFEAFFSGSDIPIDPTGLCGRILRGTSEACFSTLSPDQGRKVVMLTAAEELVNLKGKSIEQILMAIGYSPSDIKAKLDDENIKFKMFIAAQSESLRPATWDNVIALACECYPDVAHIILSQQKLLKKFPFDKIQQLADFSFDQVHHKGTADPMFMTEANLLQSPGSVVDVRAFFYHTLQLRELFSGDGFTRMPCGKVGVVEYIAPNLPISEIKLHRLIDL